jgi:1-acyl-sn-glycerol-3-phosphate acyltransferase
MNVLDRYLYDQSYPFNFRDARPGTALRRQRGQSPRYAGATSEGQTRAWNGVVRACLRLYAAVCVPGLSIRRQAPLPAGPKIIAINHANVTDPFLLPSIFPGLICALGQASLFDLPVVGRLLALSGNLPVVPGQPDVLLEAAGRQLRRGYSIAVCPEGRLNHGGPLHRAGVGTVCLALQSGFPIVPVGFYVPARYARVMRATVGGRATHACWQFDGTCLVEVGQPWWPGRGAGGDHSYWMQRQLTNQLMEQIAALVRQAQARSEA